MDDFDDYLSEEEAKLMAKQNKCLHNSEFFLFIKCQNCGKAWSEKTLQFGLKNDIIKESGN